MPSNDDDLFEGLDKLSDAIFAVCDEIGNIMDWGFLSEYIQPILKKFMCNMDDLEAVFSFGCHSDNDHPFLIGTIWGGILSAYEGFLHDLCDGLIENDDFFQMAVQTLHNISQQPKSPPSTINNANNDIRKIVDKFKITNPKLTKQELTESLRKEILNSPNKGTKILNDIFDLKLLNIDNKYFEEAKKIRNAYAHNDGKSYSKNGSLECDYSKKMSWSELLNFHKRVDQLVAEYVESLNNKTNLKLQKFQNLHNKADSLTAPP